MTRKPVLTTPLPIILFLTLLLRITACEKHNHFNLATFASPLQRQNHSDNGATLTVGIIAGIVVGGIALIVIIVLLTLCITKRCANRAQIYQGFADWRKDRNLTSVEIDRRNMAKSVIPTASGQHGERPDTHAFESV